MEAEQQFCEMFLKWGINIFSNHINGWMPLHSIQMLKKELSHMTVMAV